MNINSKQNFSRFGQLSWQSFVKEARIMKYGILIRKTNWSASVPAMVRTQEETKEELERLLPLEETKEEICVPGKK